MNRWLVAIICMLLGCRDRTTLEAKEREIAALKSKLAEVSLGSEHNPSPEIRHSRTGAPTEEPAVKNEDEIDILANPNVLIDDDTRLNVKGSDIVQALNKIKRGQVGSLLAILDVPKFKHFRYGQIKKDYRAARNIPYDFTGRILEIAESDGITRARITESEYGDSVFYVLIIGTGPFVEKDIVDVAGFITEPYTYTSQAGWQITIPAMRALPLMKAGTLRDMRRKLAAEIRRRGKKPPTDW